MVLQSPVKNKKQKIMFVNFLLRPLYPGFFRCTIADIQGGFHYEFKQT